MELSKTYFIGSEVFKKGSYLRINYSFSYEVNPYTRESLYHDSDFSYYTDFEEVNYINDIVKTSCSYLLIIYTDSKYKHSYLLFKLFIKGLYFSNFRNNKTSNDPSIRERSINSLEVSQLMDIVRKRLKSVRLA